ncbi:fumarylacetoacetate hydrolase domain-containing protein 2-like [Anoplophora glabripennis]|uniref:fumarylacetoacetate hydrolase domain-containing protein 2-like n=1 Tax=Anoplophora glabripennis TaxID=217634 RepID=UPI0008749270|nr:fumarylacetoacetate hydrolase domain-containing protein 2-like [Anoplophora glabripennis]
MKIVQFLINDDRVRVGVLDGENVIDLNASDDTIPPSLVEFLAEGDALDRIQKVVSNPGKLHRLAEVQLLPPITRPDKVLGVALNYKEACDRGNIPYPAEPIVFSKFASTIIGPYDVVKKPLASEAVDWEVELVVVIGKKAQNVRAENALDYVFGYTATQDLTAKDWITRNGGQMLLCKNMDNFCPLGPCVITKDEIPDPHNIRVKTWVNGVLKQDGNTVEMVHRIHRIIEYLSRAMTLLPGDIICTGTPSGVGATQYPPQYLQKGDLLESEVEKIGRMANRIV